MMNSGMMDGKGLFQWGNGLFSWSPAFMLIMLWSLVWKGLALWHSARRKEPIWFVVLLLVNTVGILEIIYLFFIAKVKRDQLFSSK